ncbi:MAG TPA: UDP-N-acetylmuramoyl-tripeptide--D-alanyl-D-alanine ligase [Gammaproteobacteria bacterium]|nr:UDP-N-acetylmuramoyl-tripeptide--D-alanyl-D-alanine ligase [Gammaproteobacteria bacterium]
MNAPRLSEVAAATAGRLLGADRNFLRISADTRRLAADELFVALRGAHFDGHDFVAQAGQLGAAGALVEQQVTARLPQIVVADTRRALGVYAAHWRRGFGIPVVGVTGSNGKTTVKEMIASVLRQRGETLATRGNQNNDIGVPLTLLELNAQHRAAVIEMGTNHPGEIAYLASLVAASVAVVTNAGSAHLEALGSVRGVALEKGALFAGLPAGGIAVINAEDEFAPLWREMAGRRAQRSFGLSAAADFRPAADSLRQLAGGVWEFTLQTPDDTVAVHLSLPGRHNVMNALAAAAAAQAAGANLGEISAGLARVPQTHGRLIVLSGAHGGRLVDDSYNANPVSLKAAVEFAVSLGDPVWLVLGDMGELGASAAALHAECGELARRLDVRRLWTCGNLSRHASGNFGAGAEHFEDCEALIQALRGELRAGITVLVKGSRAMRMERVVEALRASPALAGAAGGG